MQGSLLLTVASAFAVAYAGYDALSDWETKYDLSRLEREYANEYLLNQFLRRLERTTWDEEGNKGLPITCKDESTTDFLREVDRKLQELKQRDAVYYWVYSTNVTKENKEKYVEADTQHSKAMLKIRNEAAKFDQEELKRNGDEDCARMLKLLLLTAEPKGDEDIRELSELGAWLKQQYAEAKFCDDNGKCYKGETDLVKLFANPDTGFDKLQWAWEKWADATKGMKDNYVEFVGLMNEGARENGYDDAGEYWRISEMEDEHFDEKAFKIWEEVKEMYVQLHAYVRKKLMVKYPGKIKPRGAIPAHLFGNVWGQQWQNIYSIVAPYPDDTLDDVTELMKEQDYTVMKMFKTAESFFNSIGLYNMTKKFWSETNYVNPRHKDRVVECHASAMDMFAPKKDDYRIKMCSGITMEDLITIHHEMGHIEYYMCYRNQPVLFRSGANSAFHEAVGDTIALSVMTPRHLRKIGLGKDQEEDQEADTEKTKRQTINFLMKVALEKLAFLPYGLLIDTWRWGVFNGSITPENYNHAWWDLRLKFQGQIPPVDRTKEDFDPGSKYHVPDNTPYIRYYVSFLMQFQFHKALCDLAKHEGPLHTCDIFKSKDAGEKFKEMLALGQSRPWQDTLKTLTGNGAIDVSAIKEYFKPLVDWLKLENSDTYVGWDIDPDDIDVEY